MFFSGLFYVMLGYRRRSWRQGRWWQAWQPCKFLLRIYLFIFYFTFLTDVYKQKIVAVRKKKQRSLLTRETLIEKISWMLLETLFSLLQCLLSKLEPPVPKWTVWKSTGASVLSEGARAHQCTPRAPDFCFSIFASALSLQAVAVSCLRFNISVCFEIIKAELNYS